MIRTKRREHSTDGGTVIQFSVLGLVVFSVSLVVSAAIAVYTMDLNSRKSSDKNSKVVSSSTESHTNASASLSPWGDLITSDVLLDPPDEYLAFELENIKSELWRFPGLKADQVRAELERCGLSADQVRRAMELSQAETSSSETLIRPDDALVMSLSRAARAKLYEHLSLTDDNHYMR